MIRTYCALLLLTVFMGLAIEPVNARPDYLSRYQADPYRRAGMDGCGVCHDNPAGGGPRNEFGSAFDAAGRTITPLLRSNFPDRFEFEINRLADGSVFYFSDPENKFVVLKRGDQKYPVDLAAIAVVRTEVEKIPPPENRMGFFVTSKGPGNGGHLGGLAGADRHCQELAEAVGAGDRTWRAYLSTSYQDAPAVNAGDRIGTGPWYNAKGVMIARGVADLHKRNRISKEMALNEKGEMIGGFGDQTVLHDILTGTLPDGTAAVGQNCNNWSSSSEGTAMVGHHDRKGSVENASSWNSAHTTRSCSQQDFRANGGDGLFYCFAVK